MKIFETTVKGIGKDAALFAEEAIVILFGENAPDSLAGYCYQIETVASEGDFTTEQQVTFDNQSYQVTAVGSLVKRNLDELGHITIKFDGSEEAELPGTLYVEEKKMPEIEVGSRIKVEKIG